MKQLYIVRHGQTLWNVEERLQGRLDSALTDLGQQQAREHGSIIKTQLGLAAHSRGAPDAPIMWVSPSGRTRETATIVNSFVKARMLFDDGLMERDCGEWSGLSRAELRGDHLQEWNRREADPYFHRPPGGENLQDMAERVRPFLESLYTADTDVAILVTHGVMSRVILRYFLDLGTLEATRVRHPNNLFYRLTFHAVRIDVHHFVSDDQAGSDARDGLLRADAGETIVHASGAQPPQTETGDHNLEMRGPPRSDG